MTMKYLLLSVVLAACGSEGGPTGTVCPQASTLTYDNFGKQFMDTYCIRCHSSALTGNDRFGAPRGHDYDTLAGVQAMPEHIDETSAAGPDAVNTAMPPGAPFPSESERRQLGEWLACGAP